MINWIIDNIVNNISNPLVSVIVPCFKQAQYLSETLDSVLAQTYLNWECIIVNDGSPDNTEEIALSFCDKDYRFKYLKQDNQGVSNSRNNGILMSSGEYILPLDADDIIDPSYIEKAEQILDKHPEIKVVYCLADKFGSANEEWYLPEYDFRKMLFENLIFCSALFRRSDFDRSKGYDDKMVSGLEDWDFWLSLLGPEDKVHRIDEILFHYRIKDVSRNSVSKDEKQVAFLCRIIYNNHKEYYAEYVQDIITLVRKYNSARCTIDRINNSLSMKIGRTFTKPFGIIRDKLFR